MTTAKSGASAVYRRIDMSHGLMQSIVRNQIDRDEYHKMMIEKTEKVKRKVESSQYRPTRANLYVPPHLRRAKNKTTAATTTDSCPASSQSSAETSPDRLNMRRRIRERLEKQLNGKTDADLVPSMSALTLSDEPRTISQAKMALFNLSLQGADGSTSDFVIYSTDNAARTSKYIARVCGLSEEECRRLRLKIEEEQSVRMKN
ncbi:hypothetical protein QR680_009148 [Steinernema hermaphroditum]|uniref:Uncharacterized protein n=1 Tax=Steinernema hermaphroditum TaxID=289476 RepID=A0AA39IJ72_9BILA|nr:hypothetical protein QR680_009148 [Steinernema hermaphroditum]